jgi:hypothetical protein
MTVPGREDTELIVRLLSSTGVVAAHGLLMPVERELVRHINVRVGTRIAGWLRRLVDLRNAA